MALSQFTTRFSSESTVEEFGRRARKIAAHRPEINAERDPTGTASRDVYVVSFLVPHDDEDEDWDQPFVPIAEDAR